MSRLLEIEAFVAVQEHGSFAAAATELGVSASYVSKLVSRLEGDLGVRLMHRTTRRHTLTPAGERYLADCREAMLLLRRSAEDLADEAGDLRGRLRVTAPTGLGLGAVAGVLHAFALDHPEVELQVTYLDRIVDVVGEGYDLAVRVGDLPDSSLHARRLGAYRKRLVATPRLIQGLGAVGSPEELRGSPAVVYSGDPRPNVWTLSRADEVVTVPIERRLMSNSGRALAEAAAAGLGIAYLPAFHSAPFEETGRLVPVLQEWGATVPVHAIFPTRRFLPRRVRLLIDRLVAAFSGPP